jgi:DNA-binding transcriptional ArsR family regulator
VTIPFAKRLAELVPPVAVRLRRDFGAVLALIRAHALLHQARRSRDVKGRIVAEIEDYAIVRGLLADVVSQGVERTVKPEVRELVAKVGELMSESEEVTQRQLADALDLDKASVSRWVRATLDAGYLVNREDRKGRRHRLVTGDPLPDDLEILPSPELVAPLATPEQEAKAERLSRVDLSDDPGAT